MIRLLVASALLALTLAGCATTTPETAPLTEERRQELAVFRPAPDGRQTQIDYRLYDAWLEATVIQLGPSTRAKPARPRNLLQTRVKHGHQSDLRLEGNKLPISQFNAELRSTIAEYTESLVQIGQRVPITKLPRNEQLAYWMNLHNALVITTLVEEYPVREPSRLRIGPAGETLHHAPIVNIKGVDLSLRDIREGIVYSNWDNPDVFYGFWHGDLASPSLRDEAWTGANLRRGLSRNAGEFVNGLRGVRERNGITYVSPLYEETRSYFFEDWPGDLYTHLSRHADGDVGTIVSSANEIAYSDYERRIADLAGGETYTPISPEFDATDNDARTNDLPPGVREMIQDINRKFQSPTFRIKFREMRRGKVTIIDEGQGDDKDEAEEIE
jgi:hypothetical protein